jgi:general L-amino acid transport system permease protein
MTVTQSIRSRPIRSLGPIGWMRKNLFSTWYNTVLTAIGLYVVIRVLIGLVSWLLNANWAPVTTSPILYVVGQYPQEELWRIGLSLWIVSLLFGLSWAVWGNLIRNVAITMAVGLLIIGIIVPFDLANVTRTMLRLFIFSNIAFLLIGYGIGQTRVGKVKWVLLGWLLSLPIIIILLRGLAPVEKLPVVETTLWGGLLVNLLLAAIGITASFPLGVMLALGRRSSLPVVKVFSTLFIEIVRGVPLVSILFMASILLPLFLPEDFRIDRMVRALIGITLFSAAYMAENVRGGLQAIPLGQYDAAKAIGLSGTLTTLLIVLPQALRLVIPAIVGQFISLFKDTTLVLIVGLIEILGIGKSIIAGNPEWVGAQAEVYVFVAVVFWVFTYSMSSSSRRVEKALGVGER